MEDLLYYWISHGSFILKYEWKVLNSLKLFGVNSMFKIHFLLWFHTFEGNINSKKEVTALLISVLVYKVIEGNNNKVILVNKILLD